MVGVWVRLWWRGVLMLSVDEEREVEVVVGIYSRSRSRWDSGWRYKEE